ncbi:MAG: InlB B-repeat-containing protein [Clostridia bacterium]|nr:InlB B-repeat-containing protein [Clostridia bacterium]
MDYIYNHRDRKGTKVFLTMLIFVLLITISLGTYLALKFRPLPEVVHYTVTFDADNGTDPVDVQVAEGNVVHAPSEDPTKTGYNFLGWFDAYSYAWDFEHRVVTSDVTIKAQWQEIETPLTPDQNYIVTLNMILAETEETSCPTTMFELIELLKANGYEIENQNLTTGKIVWDSANNRCALISLTDDVILYQDAEKPLTTDKVAIWGIYDSYASAKEDTNNFSIYLRVTSETEILNLTRGLDIGNNTGITKISYVGGASAQTVTIRTNSTETVLEINAPNDTVYHYGINGYLNIIKSDLEACYHEFGYSHIGEATYGRIVNHAGTILVDGEEKSTGIQFLYINTKEEGADEFDTLIVAAADGAKLPEFDRPEVNIADGGTLVVKVEQITTSHATPDAEEYIYLWKSGVKEQIVVTEVKVGGLKVNDSTGKVEGNNGEKATIGSTNVENESTSKAAEEIANLARRGANGQLIDADGNDIDISKPEEIDTTKVVDVERPTKEEAMEKHTLFEGGKGTIDMPYLIANVEQFMNIDNALNETLTDIYFKLTTNLDMQDEFIQAHRVCVWDRWELFAEIYDSTILHIDLGGNTMYNLNCFIFSNIQNLEFENGTVCFAEGESEPGIAYYSCGGNGYPRHLIFRNLVLNGQYSPNMLHYGPVLAQSYDGYLANDVILAENIVSNVNINNLAGNAYTGGIFGYVFGPLTIKDCIFNGSIQSAYVGSFINPMNAGGTKINQNNTFNGKLLGTNTVQKFGAGINSVETEGPNASATKVTKADDLIKSANMGEELVLNHTNSSIVRYAVSIMVWTNEATCTTVFNVDVTATSTDCHTGLYKNYFENSLVDGSTESTRVPSGWYDGCIWLDGDTYMVYCSSTTQIKTSSPATICVYGYDADGNLTTYQTQQYSPAK